ncbi:MAG: KH domain-containing protein [archaeon]
MAEYVKIPEERLDLILADNEKIKKLIEKSTNIKLEIDKQASEVAIISEGNLKDPLVLWHVRDVIKAIGRGFDPEIALELLNKNKELKIIDLSHYVGKSKNQLVRIRGRIIGRNGKSKELIEETTNTHMVIYGKTVCIIGSLERVHIAAQAVDRLASGSMHGSVFKIIEQEAKNLAFKR